jgi:hypothetical protein
MKKSYLIIKIIAYMFCLSMLINAQNNTGISQNTGGMKSFNVNKGGTLNVSISSGDIRITTWDKNEVNIKIDSEDKEDINAIKASLEGNTVTVKNNYSYSWGWSGDVSLKISIPSDFNTEIHTQSGDVIQTGYLKGTATVFTAGGDIRVGDVSGRTTLKSNGGDITTGNVGSELTLSTNGGDVRTGTVSGKLTVSTMGGSINVTKADKDLSLNTMGGDITVGNVGGTADVKTMGGSIGLGKVSGSANMSTYGGDISLAGANGNIEATTFGGNIRLTNVTGSVNADTKSGDIYVELTPSGNSSNKIKTLNGNVVLYLPSNAKVNISATVVVRHYNRRDEEKELMNLIHSDFDAKNPATINKRGDKIVADYVINGGGENINIYTVNGKIEIRKK